MSLEALGNLSRWTGLPLNLTAVAFRLADCHNAVTGQCNPSNAYLAERCGTSERTIQRILSELETAGVVLKTAQFDGGGRQRSNSYRICPPPTMEGDAGVRGDTGVVGEGDISVGGEGDTGDTQKQEEGIRNIETNISAPSPKSKPSPVAKEQDDSFDRFWSEYPKKEDKKRARKLWASLPKKHKDAALADICGSRGRYKAWPDEKSQYIPNPCTYLNREKWDDDDRYPRAGSKPATERKFNGPCFL